MPENPSKRFELVEKPGKPRPLPGTRRWQRYPLDVPIRVIVDTPGKTKLYDSRGNELSEGGMAVTAGAERSPGRQVAIEFTPPLHLRPHPSAWHCAQPHWISLWCGIPDGKPCRDRPGQPPAPDAADFEHCEP